MSPVERFLDANGFTQTEVAEAAGIERSTFSRKVGGDRPWRLTEIQAIVAFASERLGRAVTYEEVVGSPLVDHDPAPVEAK